MKKNVSGARSELVTLTRMCDVLVEAKTFSFHEELNSNTRQLCILQESNDRSARALEIMQVILAGGLAFEILDRITGSWSVIDAEWMTSFKNSMLDTTPMVK